MLYFHELSRGGPELFSAPWDSSHPAVRLHGELVENGGVLGPTQVLADGTVLFKVDLEGYLLHQLHRVPIDGSAPPRVLSGPMAPGGSVLLGTFLVSPDGQRVLYRADQETDGVAELFAAFFRRPPRRSPTPSRTIVR